MPKKY